MNGNILKSIKRAQEILKFLEFFWASKILHIRFRLEINSNTSSKVGFELHSTYENVKNVFPGWIQPKTI